MRGCRRVQQKKPTGELYRTVSGDANFNNPDKGQIVGTGNLARK